MRGRWYQHLSAQLIALLTLAFLPLGLIALFQTNRVAIETDRTTGLALMGLTERAAAGEQLLIERAVGAARVFGTIAPDLLSDPENCTANLIRFVNANPEYSFIGVVPASGFVNCSSSPEPLDLRQDAGFQEAVTNQVARISVRRSGAPELQSAFIVSEPFEIGGQFAGFVSVSVPHSGVPETSQSLEELGLEELITFNEVGEILTSRSFPEQAMLEMPEGVSLEGLSTERPLNFRGTNREGIERRYSIVTIAGSPAAVMAVWRIGDNAVTSAPLNVAPILFPVLMWIASMVVAMLAVHSLVGRHLRRLQRKMNQFAENRRIEDGDAAGAVIPTEIAQLEENFDRMSQDILRDEAVLEDALRDKDVLVKEIHHRVKNNLQLISSIINMQVREAQHEETRGVLRRVQERVLSLATIHRDLYQSQNAGRVNSGALVSEIIEKSTDFLDGNTGHVKVTKAISPILLYPDQAVPLSMLAAEATTNAMKYIGDLGDKGGWIDVSLVQDDLDCEFVLSNSVGDDGGRDSTGLGSRLMKAFAMQLGGDLTTEQAGDQYTLKLTFKALEFQPEQRDY